MHQILHQQVVIIETVKNETNILISSKNRKGGHDLVKLKCYTA